MHSRAVVLKLTFPSTFTVKTCSRRPPLCPFSCMSLLCYSQNIPKLRKYSTLPEYSVSNFHINTNVSNKFAYASPRKHISSSSSSSCILLCRVIVKASNFLFQIDVTVIPHPTRSYGKLAQSFGQNRLEQNSYGTKKYMCVYGHPLKIHIFLY